MTISTHPHDRPHAGRPTAGHIRGTKGAVMYDFIGFEFIGFEALDRAHRSNT